MTQGRVIIENLAKTYHVKQRKGLFKAEEKAVEALKGVSLEIAPGEVFGLLGPNGAGKTTLIKCLTTLLLPTSGRVQINGYELAKQDNAIRATVGCMLMGERGLYWKLTGRENLVFFGALYHLSRAERRKRADTIIEKLELSDIADRTVETYSSGQRMKLAFAKALINDAPLLILDEPTNTLDVPSARELRAVVRELNAEGKTVIYTTHIMSEAETLCDRVAIVDRGEVLAMGAVPELKASLKREAVIRIEGVISKRAAEAVHRLPGVSQAATTAANGHQQLTVVAEDHQALLPELIQTLTAHNAIMQKITPEEVTLEDVFIARTGRTLADDTRVK
ncbi:MAG: ABC transporter ATP-binding protein [Chloroflexi bacterium]|nr:ABC transporter ATP-binding protein [Chloroflexota bacterium]